MAKELKKYKCWKCNHIILAYEKPIVCVQPMPFRTSGICAGSYQEIKENYND